MRAIVAEPKVRGTTKGAPVGLFYSPVTVDPDDSAAVVQRMNVSLCFGNDPALPEGRLSLTKSVALRTDPLFETLDVFESLRMC